MRTRRKFLKRETPHPRGEQGGQREEVMKKEGPERERKPKDQKKRTSSPGFPVPSPTESDVEVPTTDPGRSPLFLPSSTVLKNLVFFCVLGSNPKGCLSRRRGSPESDPSVVRLGRKVEGRERGKTKEWGLSPFLFSGVLKTRVEGREGPKPFSTTRETDGESLTLTRISRRRRIFFLTLKLNFCKYLLSKLKSLIEEKGGRGSRRSFDGTRDLRRPKVDL